MLKGLYDFFPEKKSQSLYKEVTDETRNEIRNISIWIDTDEATNKCVF